jgi:hypothetical protein
MPTPTGRGTARMLPGSQAEALALIRHIAEASGVAVPAAGSGAPPNVMDVIAAHAMQPWLMSEHVNEANFLTIPALSGFVPILTYTCPARNAGIIEGFTNAVSAIQQFDYVQWQVRINDAAIPEWDLIGGPIGFFPDVVQRVFWPLFQGQTLTVLANNIATIPAPFITAKILGRVFPDTLPD